MSYHEKGALEGTIFSNGNLPSILSTRSPGSTTLGSLREMESFDLVEYFAEMKRLHLIPSDLNLGDSTKVYISQAALASVFRLLRSLDFDLEDYLFIETLHQVAPYIPGAMSAALLSAIDTAERLTVDENAVKVKCMNQVHNDMPLVLLKQVIDYVSPEAMRQAKQEVTGLTEKIRSTLISNLWDEAMQGSSLVPWLKRDFMARIAIAHRLHAMQFDIGYPSFLDNSDEEIDQRLLKLYGTADGQLPDLCEMSVFEASIEVRVYMMCWRVYACTPLNMSHDIAAA